MLCWNLQLGAEIISTFILVFTGCGAAVVDAKSHGSVSHLGVSIAFGIVIMIMIYAVGHISGAHMNPAVTIAFATVRHFPWKDVSAFPPLWLSITHLGIELTSADYYYFNSEVIFDFN